MPIQRTAGSDTVPASPTAAILRESQRVLQLYTEAFAGRSFELRSTADLPDAGRARDRRLPTSSLHCVFLPDDVDIFASAAENFGVFKVDILHQLGYWECGTFGFRLDIWRRRRGTGPEPVEDNGLAGFFAATSSPELARILFANFEGGRIDAHLARRYHGLAADLARVVDSALRARPSFAGMPPALQLLEAQVRMSLGAPVAALDAPGLDRQIGTIARWAEELSGREATVYSTADAVAACLPLFEGLPVPARRTAALDEAVIDDGPGASSSEAGEAGERAAADATPVEFRGDLKPDIVQKELELDNLVAGEKVEGDGSGSPISAELLEQLLRSGQVEIGGVENAELSGSTNLSVTDLPLSSSSQHRRLDPDEVAKRLRDLRRDVEAELGDRGSRPDAFFYDEWDYRRNGYRQAWCRLLETILTADDAEDLEAFRTREAPLFTAVRKQFELLRPDTYRRLKRLTDGEEVDLDAAVEALTDLRAGISPSEKVYTRLNRRERDVAAAFLLDMSASTDSEVATPAVEAGPPPPAYDYVGVLDDDPFWTRGAFEPPPRRRSVIDVEKESLVLMAEALEALGDAYGVYGFSGYGRENVDYFIAKDFDDSFDREVLGRIAAIRPKRSTRMGPAIRHTIRKLEARQARMRVLMILSDGYPQDFDYGPDRTSREYGLRDTMMALREAEMRGIHTYCITVDPAGHNYLREMCPEHRYLVIDDIAELPQELPKVYKGLTT